LVGPRQLHIHETTILSPSVDKGKERRVSRKRRGKNEEKKRNKELRKEKKKKKKIICSYTLFVCLINRTFSANKQYVSYNKSANSTFSHGFLA
jgi:hypothetical protein